MNIPWDNYSNQLAGALSLLGERKIWKIFRKGSLNLHTCHSYSVRFVLKAFFNERSCKNFSLYALICVFNFHYTAAGKPWLQVHMYACLIPRQRLTWRRPGGHREANPMSCWPLTLILWN